MSGLMAVGGKEAVGGWGMFTRLPRPVMRFGLPSVCRVREMISGRFDNFTQRRGEAVSLIPG